MIISVQLRREFYYLFLSNFINLHIKNQIFFRSTFILLHLFIYMWECPTLVLYLNWKKRWDRHTLLILHVFKSFSKNTNASNLEYGRGESWRSRRWWSLDIISYFIVLNIGKERKLSCLESILFIHITFLNQEFSCAFSIIQVYRRKWHYKHAYVIYPFRLFLFYSLSL